MTFVRTKSGLWVPPNSSAMAKDVSPKNLTGMIAAFLTWSELTGAPRPLKELRARINRFEIIELLGLACELGVYLHNDGILNTDLQVGMAQTFLDKDIYARYCNLQDAHQEELRGGPFSYLRPLFTPTLLIHYVKRVLIEHTGLGTEKFDSKNKPIETNLVAQGILGYTNYLARESKRVKREPQRTQEIAKEFFRNAAFSSQESVSNLLRRYYLLFFDYARRPELKAKYKIDIDQVFAESSEASDVPLKEFFAIGFGVRIKFMQFKYINNLLNANQKKPPVAVNWREHFKDVKIGKDTLLKIKKLYSQTIEEAQTSLKATAADDAKAFDYQMLPLIKRPLLELSDDWHVITHLPFLDERFTHGIYWIIADALSADKTRFASFKNLWGFAFQQYLWELFTKHVAPESKLSPYLTFYDKEYGQSNSKQASDIICFLADERKELLLFELTTSQIRAEATTKVDNWQTVLDDTKRITTNKAKQLNRNIQDIRSGELVLAGVNPSEIKTYRPVIVTLKPYPSLRFLWAGIDGFFTGITSELQGMPELAKADVVPLKVVCAEEFEKLIDIARAGHSFFDTLKEWADHPQMQEYSLDHFLRIEKESFLSKAPVDDITLDKIKSDLSHLLFKEAG
ncbi:MAG: hypothetical protein C0508_06440 [Cyanobacteria bacterium PR.023]|nr:hypothetical protein [Cyanobacteria bacterium PR.023]